MIYFKTKDFLFQAPVAVGVAAHSSYDMYMAGGRGKCVEILHAMGDSLCQLGKPAQRPKLGKPFDEVEDEEEEESEESLSEEIETLDVGGGEIRTETIEERLKTEVRLTGSELV